MPLISVSCPEKLNHKLSVIFINDHKNCKIPVNGCFSQKLQPLRGPWAPDYFMNDDETMSNANVNSLWSVPLENLGHTYADILDLLLAL